jgi:hypothetical protein
MTTTSEETFDDKRDSGSWVPFRTPTGTPQPLLSRIGGWTLGDEQGEPHSLIDVGDVRYCFVGGAIKAGLIEASWTERFEFKPVVYFRTDRTVLRSRRRSLDEVQARLPSRKFLRANHPIVVNLAKITDYDFRGRKKRVAFGTRDRDLEWVTLSNDGYRLVRFHMGL